MIIIVNKKFIENIVIVALMIIGLFMIPFGDTYVYGIVISLSAVLASLYLAIIENKKNGKKNILAWVTVIILIIIPVSYLVLASTSPGRDGLELLGVWAKSALFIATIAILLAIVGLFNARR